jgi:ElaB/YqjD/DUF883 family membrane-anchored ribosome-binding protein
MTSRLVPGRRNGRRKSSFFNIFKIRGAVMADTIDPEDGLDEGAETASGEGSESVVDAQRRFQGVQDRYRKVSDDVRRGAERARAEFQRGTERAKDTYHNAAESAREGYGRLRDNAGNVTNEVSAFVRDNPARAVLIAAAAGFLLGMLVRRGRDDYDDEE